MKVWDREKNIIYEEKEYGKKKLEFLYNNFFGRILLKLVFTTRWFSNIQALYQKSRFSKKKISNFIKKYNINMKYYSNIEQYNSFSDFFKRKRNILNKSDNNELVSIADSKLQYYEITEDLKLKIKNSIYSLEELVDDKEIAQKFQNGICLVYRLAMDDYHRYMFLDKGKVISSKYIKGTLHTIRPISSKYNTFTRNSRNITILNTKNFGQVIQIEVGAMLVGKIVNYEKDTFDKLEEKGFFDFGGSTIVQLFEKNIVDIDKDIVEKSRENIETKVTIGMKIGYKRR